MNISVLKICFEKDNKYTKNNNRFLTTINAMKIKK